jgi:MoxR-like ATPase
MDDLNLRKSQLLKKDLAAVGHFVEEETAVTLASWWDMRGGPLILEGPPGGGKTSLAETMARVAKAPLLRIQCYKSINKQETLYSWNETLQRFAVEQYVQHHKKMPEDVSKIIYRDEMMVPGVLLRALRNTNPHLCLLIDELDKVPRDESFEAFLLEFLGENAITIPERNERIRPASGFPVHTFITSNAGVDSSSVNETLSYPILRRGVYIWVPEPDLSRQYEILLANAPTLNPEVIRDAALFVNRAMSLHEVDKPIALSETIMWVRKLQWMGVQELTEEIALKTCNELVKTRGDVERLKAVTKRLIHHVRNHRDDLNLKSLAA